MNNLGLNVPLSREQYTDTNLPHVLGSKVADTINSVLGTSYKGRIGFQGDSVNITLG